MCIKCMYVHTILYWHNNDIRKFYCTVYSGSNKAMLKVAHMCAQLQQYEKSIKLFEEVS